MTEAAARFVTPLTFCTLSRKEVYVDQFADVDDWKPEHISLA
jgi:phosphopantothenoylcysteine decarboxylase/phosphopantothenate--cysteine ligase